MRSTFGSNSFWSRSMRHSRAATSLLAITTLFYARAGHARDCSRDADCPRGFQCAPNDADSPNGTCLSHDCASDTDCGPALRCLIGADTECVTAADGSDVCHPGSYCSPQWDVPCARDSDCGPGFTCSGTGKLFLLGPSEDAAVPAYATEMPIACSDIDKPPSIQCVGDAGCPIQAPEIGQPGGRCGEIVWQTCEPQVVSLDCSVDSDCPQSWRCACPPCYQRFGPDGDAGATSGDCTKQCQAPNIDLSNGGNAVCFGDSDFATPSVSNSAADAGMPSRINDAGLSTSVGASRPHASGGCDVTQRRARDGGRWIAIALLALTLMGSRRRARRAS